MRTGDEVMIRIDAFSRTSRFLAKLTGDLADWPRCPIDSRGRSFHAYAAARHAQ
jgi:hypothetical protein